MKNLFSLMLAAVLMLGAMQAAAEKFSIAVLPDTQNEVLGEYAYQNMMVNRMNWLVANKDALNLKWVLCAGDYIDWDTPDHIHYERGSEAFQILTDGGLPFMISMGNHDSLAVCTGGSACPGDTNANLRNHSLWNTYWPVSRFPDLRGTWCPDDSVNAYYTFTAGGLNWLVLTLELWARAEPLNWAETVLAAHPEHNVILVTHAHFYGAVGFDVTNGGYGNNTAVYVFDQLKKYANLRMVFCGHGGTHGYRTDTGDNGNTVYSLLQCYHQGTHNVTRIVEIDTENGSFYTYIYAPNTDTMFNDGSELTVTGVDWVRPGGGTVEPEPEPEPEPGQLDGPADPFGDVSVKGSVLRERGDVIRFEGVPVQAELDIYTLTGRLVASLNESYFSGGIIDWDGVNLEAAQVKPGIYVYVLTDADGNRKSGKVVVR